MPQKANLWLIFALSIFAWAPLLTPAYFFQAHDAQHTIFYLVEFSQTWQDGYWWPRWSPDFAFGYGYPLFNIYAPLAIYAATLLAWLGLSFITAIKTMYILASIAAGAGMYGFVRRLFGEAAGLLAAVAYMYAPFHLVDIFVRSAYAEFVALAMIPFLFWSFTELIAQPTRRRVAIAGLVYGLLALTHHTSFFTFTPLLMAYILYLTIAKVRPTFRPAKLVEFLRQATYSLAAGILGVALAAIYLIPALTEAQYVKVEQWTSGSYNYLEHFVYLSQFLAPQWGYGYAGPGTRDEFSYQLGIGLLTLVIFASLNIITRQFPHRGTAAFLGLASLSLIWLMSPLAEPVWQTIPLATLVQFPWRLLGVTAFTMATLSGALLAPTNAKIPPPEKPAMSAQLGLLAFVVILASYPFTLPQYTAIPEWAETPLAVINWDRGSIVDRVGMMAVTEEQPQTSPLEQRYLNNEPLLAGEIIAGSGELTTLHRGGASSKIQVMAEEPVNVQFYTYDYPGWQVTRNGEPIAHRPAPPYGLITVELPAGDHELELTMGTTTPRTVGTILSGLAIIVIVGLLIVPQKSSFA